MSSEIPSGESATPLMKQYWDLKTQAGDALLLFRMGDFYELFGADAVEASRILEITLTSRDRNRPNPTPMAGVPHHSVQSYIQKLLAAGRKVAIGEQMEDPALVKGKGIVKREITRVFTPAVQFEAEGSESAYLAVFWPIAGEGRGRGPRWLLAAIDPSTGDSRISEGLEWNRLAEIAASLSIKHLLKVEGRIPPELDAIESRIALREPLPTHYVTETSARALVKAHFGEAFFAGAPTEQETAAAFAFGTLLQYTARAQKVEKLAHLRFPIPLAPENSLRYAPQTADHLDLMPGPQPHLFGRINRTRSAAGARKLKDWLLHPLRVPAEIQARQTAIRAIHGSLSGETLSSLSAEAYDLERIAGRIQAGLAGPRDTLAWGRTLNLVPRFLGLLDAVCSGGEGKSEWLLALGGRLRAAWPRVEELAARICEEQRDPAPLVARDGGIFRPGRSAELDRLLDLATNGQRFLVELEARERQATGIGSLKVRYNRVFGYYIEVTQAHLDKVPAHYQRKQTTVGAERFFTEELKKFEDEIVQADSRQKALEQSLFNDRVAEIAACTPAALEIAAALAELDAIQSLAALLGEPGWVFPEIDDSRALSIEGGRHPVVEASASSGSFVPNDLALGAESRRTLVITGPNMGGKSTLLRQTAVIVILGQMGAPVPARSARWGAVHSIHTRIGAHDAIARGQSTFMVEMAELAQILHSADDRSLIILDEIGRGTSTFDGISVAWAALEWIAREIRGRTLFATHYHELTRLSETLPGLANAHLGVDKSGSRIRFLFELRDGPANESFGVHVAEIAGLPKPVVDRAWQVLEDLERSPGDHPAVAPSAPLPVGVGVPETAEAAVPAWVADLLAIDLDRTTPLQALLQLSNLKKKAAMETGGSPAAIGSRKSGARIAKKNLGDELCLNL